VGAPAAITNFTHYSAVDAEIEQSRINRNQAEQRRLYAAIQRKIMEDAVVIPLVNTLWVIVGRPNVELPELTGVEKPASLNYFVPVTERTRLK
jgi:peptide/nickel transport system substrate-binding protein